MREAVGRDVEIMIDAHGSLDSVTAIALARRLREFDLTWFEEPVSSDHYRAMAEVRTRGGIAIAAGENEFTRFGFRDLIESDAADYLQPDVAIAGGITECRKIGALASAHGKFLAPHAWSSAILVAASLHLGASLLPRCIFEVSQGNIPLIDNLTKKPLRIQDGYAVVPNDPGLRRRADRGLRRALPIHSRTGIRVLIPRR